MKIQISQSSIKKIDILNKVVNAWVTTTNYERENFPHSYFIALSKAFPEAVYKDIAYRRVTIDPSFIEKLHDSLYVDYKKTDADLKELENFKSDNPQEMYETQSLLFEWDRLKVKALVPNGRAMWWKALHRYIQQNSSGRYVSWSASMKGIDRSC